VSLATVGPWLPAAVIAAEDAAFREHPGYSVEGMRDAAAKNAEEGAVVRGGSTLTQQLAKNLFLDGTRSYARKLRELLYAVELEQELGKRRILELYVNVVEFGPGLRGARAAAQTYFLKEPAGLLPEEAAWLASILRFPRTAWRTQYLTDRPDDRRVDWILENLRGVPEEARLAAVGRPVRLVPPP
jgi:membrane peptidoglycan carboxypeptidase